MTTEPAQMCKRVTKKKRALGYERKAENFDPSLDRRLEHDPKEQINDIFGAASATMVVAAGDIVKLRHISESLYQGVYLQEYPLVTEKGLSTLHCWALESSSQFDKDRHSGRYPRHRRIG